MLWRITVLTVLTLLCPGSSATKNTTWTWIKEKFSNGHNASGSISFPGFRVKSSYPESEWTLYRYIASDYIETYNRSEVWQTIGMKTSQAVNLTDPNDLPYTGCYVVFMPLDDKKYVDGRSDDGSCNTMLSADCIKDIITHVNDTSASYSATSSGTNSTKLNCFELMRGIIKDKNSKCFDEYRGYNDDLFLPVLPGISSTTNATNDPIVSCPTLDPGDMDTFSMSSSRGEG